MIANCDATGVAILLRIAKEQSLCVPTPLKTRSERLARTLTEQFGVAVLCQGDQAYTDGKTIVLPSLPEPLEPNLERMMVGYLDYEMAHVEFSDFRQVKRFSKKHPGFEAMLNVVEDALIEKLAMERWPGGRDARTPRIDWFAEGRIR